MTRKQLLTLAITRLQELPDTEENQMIVDGLSELREDLPITSWDEKTIFDTVEQFFLDHGRYPNTKEFESKGLPSHPTIANRFGMTVAEFLNTYYPDRYACVHRAIRKYKELPKEHWLDVFKEQMTLHQIRSHTDYNRRHTEGPGWAYIAHLYGLTKWSDLLALADVTTAAPPKERVAFTITRKVNQPDIEELKKIQKKLQKQITKEHENQ